MLMTSPSLFLYVGGRVSHNTSHPGRTGCLVDTRMMQRSHSRLSYYRIHFVHSYLSAYLHSCQDLNDCCDSPLVHVVLGVVQPHAHLHGVTLPDEVEDVLHGEAAVVPCAPLCSPVSPLWSPVWPSTRCITITAGCWCAQVCCCPAVPSSHQPKTGQP